MKKIVMLLALSFLLAACSAAHFQETSFRLDRSDGEYSYYTYKTFAAADLPLNSETAERDRMQWLKKWLEQNNLSTTNYEIISREEYVKNKGLLGTVYDLYYEVKVPIKTNTN